MIEPRSLPLGAEAITALQTLVGIMSDHVLTAEEPRWDMQTVVELEVVLEMAASQPELPVTLGLDDVALMLEGMAFTEMASTHLPWFDMVRWTSDFITHELRSHWSDDLWRRHVSGTGT